ncbi:DUF3592 domain-containing protein [Myroides marinus]|uniref:DUF3592 domain-containing protein n=1 Tax=Myroides marinus TaxID=703342 RepID=UPI002574E09E|nr:DUF3592 domain-containing protein [Myroides marinus]MDM1379270.1 hypothetical protein [Myroides marinus]MDM1386595.1 hypothetical protein [Myroides marinus]MDM1393754.1 hypothetical protein [Myroides marinus]
MDVESSLKSDTAKKVFVIVIVIFAICVYKFIYLDYITKNEAKSIVYNEYIQVEAEIIGSERTGRRGRNITWILKYKDINGTAYKGKQRMDTFFSKSLGEKLIIYYNPSNPNEFVSEKEYKEVMN